MPYDTPYVDPKDIDVGSEAADEHDTVAWSDAVPDLPTSPPKPTEDPAPRLDTEMEPATMPGPVTRSKKRKTTAVANVW